jgi:hypothetical protein
MMFPVNIWIKSSELLDRFGAGMARNIRTASAIDRMTNDPHGPEAAVGLS